MTVAAHRRLLAGVRAKSGRHGEEGESLLDHTAAVVGRLAGFCRVFPNLASRVGDPRLWHRAFWACALHDLGKIAPGFQAQLADRARPWGHRHEVLSLAFLDWVLADDPAGDRPWVAAGIASHHRDVEDISQLYPPPEGDAEDPVQRMVADVDDRLVAALAVWLGEMTPRWAAEHSLPGVEVRLAIPPKPSEDFRRHAAARIHRGLRAYRHLVRDLGAQHASAPANLGALALRGLVLLSDHTASAHAPPARRALTGVEDVVGRLGLGGIDALFHHQRQAATVTGDVLLTAPTGSGKTEAALLWAARQQEERVGRVFYLLPYQASLNAMKDRLEGLFPGCVALQHARALQALYRRLLDKPYGPREAAAVARREHALARLHHQPVRVLTPYQLLRGSFRLKGYEPLLTDAVDGVFVFDEMHAYEPRRLGMILGLVEYAREALGGRFLVMSATLPRVLREALEAVLGRPMAVDAGPALYRAFRRHRVQVVEGWIGDAPIVQAVSRCAAAGQSVLIVCNTVERAIAVRDLVRAALGQDDAVVQLLHGRFNARDRFGKERMLLDGMGTGRMRSGRVPTVLVATQVVEVSLDIDFDTIFTEPAPLEALVQRFGRVNRGRRHAASDVHVMRQLGPGQDVYDGAYVASALDVLDAHSGRVLDETDVGPWLDRVYEGGTARTWAEEVRRARDEFRAVCIADLRAFQTDARLTDVFDRMFDATEVLPRALLDEYDRLALEEPLGSSELLVPISNGQLWQLKRAGRVATERADGVLVVDAPYNSERGLSLAAPERADV